MSGNNYLKNAALAGGHINPIKTNDPSQYKDRQHQYYDSETRIYINEIAKYASDFVEARVQGIKTGSLDEWGTYRIRITDVVRPSSAIQRHYDDYKTILFESRYVEYIRPGTKIVTMGNTWLAINPQNVSGASGSALIRRCNAVWNHYDYYGNVVSEPIIVESERASASDSDSQEGQYISKGYFNVLCQANPDTLQIDTNTRIILGTGAYRVTGYADFETEFTGDYSSIRTLAFTVRYEEPNKAIDDMVNHVASGLDFTWNISLTARNNLRVGGESEVVAESVRNGEIVEYTPQYPITYSWESSDESVATVDDSGKVTAIAEGTAIITATLNQNENISQSVEFTVTQTEDGVEFLNSVPSTIYAYDTISIAAAYFEDGNMTDNPLEWSISGGDDTMYGYTVALDGKSIEIDCFGYSDIPLTVTASYGAYTASAEIQMEGI